MLALSYSDCAVQKHHLIGTYSNAGKAAEADRSFFPWLLYDLVNVLLSRPGTQNETPTADLRRNYSNLSAPDKNKTNCSNARCKALPTVPQPGSGFSSEIKKLSFSVTINQGFFFSAAKYVVEGQHDREHSCP